MRIGQALGLRHEDIDLQARQINIVHREDNANGARGKRGVGTTFLSPRAIELYLLYMDTEYGLLDSDYVFVNLWSGEVGAPLRYSTVSDLVDRTGRRVDFKFNAHQLRHTFVTLARRNGVSLEIVSKLVLHSCVQTTADTYSHLDVDDLRAAIEKAGLWTAWTEAA